MKSNPDKYIENVWISEFLNFSLQTVICFYNIIIICVD